MPTIRKCNQVAANGTFCQSPALKNNQLCYYHNRDHARKVLFEQARQLKLSKDFADYPAKQDLLNPEILEALELPSFDDAASIQISLSNVAKAVLSGHIDTKRAGLVLYAMQIAAMNIRNARMKPLYGEHVTDEDLHPIQPLYPPNSSYFPVPNHPDGKRPPQRRADSTLGNLPRNDFPSIHHAAPTAAKPDESFLQPTDAELADMRFEEITETPSTSIAARTDSANAGTAVEVTPAAPGPQKPTNRADRRALARASFKKAKQMARTFSANARTGTNRHAP